jgi:hypothetical protein
MPKTKVLKTTDSTRDINDTRPAMTKPGKKSATKILTKSTTTTRHVSTKRKG